MAYKWNAEVFCGDTDEYGHFIFHDLSDSEMVCLMELAARGHSDQYVKIRAEKDSEDDVAVIGAMDEEVDDV